MRRPEEALMTDASARPTPAKFAAWLCLELFVLGIDQATKIWFEQNFSLGEVLPVCTGFNLVLAHNTGAAFSFLADAGGWQRWAFAALAAAVIVAMIVLLVRNSHRKLLSLSLTLIAAGALGNMIDRTVYGYVVDFLDFYWQGWHWPAFNVADVAICGGAFFLIVDELRSGRR